MDYMFNELSVSTLNSREEVRTVMETFVNTQIEAKIAGLDDLRLHENTLPNLYQINLFEEYSIDSWLQDNRVDPDLRDKFRLITTTLPLVKESDIDQRDQYSLSEFFIRLEDDNEHKIWGLGAALIYDTISFSFLSMPFWNKSVVEIKHFFLDENAEERLNYPVVKHFSNLDTLEENRDWLRQYQRDKLVASSDLWEKKDEHFRFIKFVPAVEKQLRSLDDLKILAKVIVALNQFDDYVKTWDSGGFNYQDAASKSQLIISPESLPTLQKFGAERKFYVDGLGKVLFDLHIKLSDIRIHFYPDNNSRIVHIGYIGKHLRIVSRN